MLTTEEAKTQWWYPTDIPATLIQLRKNYPEHNGMSDEEILAEFDDDPDDKFTVLWDNLGDAKDQFDKVAGRMQELEARVDELEALTAETGKE